MNKQQSLNLGGIICLVVVGYFIYYLLVLDNELPFSIVSILSNFSHWTSHWRILIVGLLPVYVALMLFGTAMLGAYLGSAVQDWLTRMVAFRLPTLVTCKKSPLPCVSKNPFQAS
ncbi:MAG: hypothetical protein ACYCQI_14765 [Gammaproteobacteria bacterium]